MCKLCENKLDYAYIYEGWVYIKCNNCGTQDTTGLPINFCPWCGEKITGNKSIMPKIVPRAWKYQMQEQEAENYEGI